MILLKKGMKGDDVREVHKLLKKNGWFFDGDPRGNFGPLTEEAVIDFQHCHLDEKGDWLEVDGIVGPVTLWALKNPSGQSQRSFIEATVPKGIVEFLQSC